MSSLTANDKRALEVVSPVSPDLGANLDAAIDAAEATAEATAAAAALASQGVTAQGVLVADYDFAVHAGAVGTIDLGVTLPDNAIVVNVKSDVVTPFTSGGAATIAIKAVAADLIAATAYGDASLTDIDDHAVANVKTSAVSAINFVIATADLTAGKARFSIEWVQGLA